MKPEKMILSLVVIAILLLTLLMSKVGYASVTDFRSEDIVGTPDQTNFKVQFDGKPTFAGEGKASFEITGNTSGIIDVKSLKAVGDSAIVIIDIKNTSHDVAALLSTSVTNSNTNFFKVTATLSNNEIHQRNGKSTLKIKVELIKKPIGSTEKTNISIKVVANPIN